jgi:hypothetical protein
VVSGSESGRESSSARPLEDPDAGFDEIIAAWGQAACGSAPVKTFTGDGDEVGGASCEYGTVREVQIWVYKSESGVKTKMASVGCSPGYLRVIGPKWDSVTKVAEVATALQDAGGRLAC